MSDTAIVQITRATALLTQAKTLEETLEVRDRASAVEAYARARGADRAQRLALELKLRAERKAGGFLREMPRVKPKDTLRRGDTMSPRDGPTLKDLGIEKKESERWQKIAAVPEDRFEDYIQSSVRKTQRGLLDLAEKQYIREPIESAHGSEPVLPIIYVDQGVVIRRVASPPSHWTFTIPPVRELLEKYRRRRARMGRPLLWALDSCRMAERHRPAYPNKVPYGGREVREDRRSRRNQGSPLRPTIFQATDQRALPSREEIGDVERYL